MDSFTVIPTSSSTAESDPIVLRQTGTTRLVFKPLLVKNPNEPKASVKGCFVFQRKSVNAAWEDHNTVPLSKLKAEEWTKLELTSEELLVLLQNMAAFYRLNAKHGLPKGKIHFLKVSSDTASGELTRLDFARLFDLGRRTGIDTFSQLLDWVTEVGNAKEVLENLNRLQIDSLQRLNSLIGLTSLKAAIKEWREHQEDTSEEFWQKTFQKHAFVLSQVFCLPVFLYKGKAYVGGKSVENTGGHIADFLFANRITKNSAIIEIKTPMTKLLGVAYRGAYGLSEELSGSIAQVLDYRLSLLTDYYSLKRDKNSDFEVFSPNCYIIAGNTKAQFSAPAQYQSFELVRQDLKDVAIIGYDELFAKTETLIDALEGTTEAPKGTV